MDNFGDGECVRAAGPSEDGASENALNPQELAELWLATEGVRIVTERMVETPGLAATRVARWKDQALAGDAATLAEIIRAVDALDYIGPRFHNLIVDKIRRAPSQASPQQELKLPPVLASERKMA